MSKEPAPRGEVLSVDPGQGKDAFVRHTEAMGDLLAAARALVEADDDLCGVSNPAEGRRAVAWLRVAVAAEREADHAAQAAFEDEVRSMRREAS